jgi:hypothetical protein
VTPVSVATVGETHLINAWVTNLSISTAPMAGRTPVWPVNIATTQVSMFGCSRNGPACASRPIAWGIR